MNPKGRVEPLEIFELVGWLEKLDQPMRERLAAFEAAMQHYRARRFEAALQGFRGIAKQSQDGPATHFAALCEDHLIHPPSTDWDGTFLQTEK